MDAAKLRPTLRELIEGNFRALAAEGHIPDRGEREITFRLDDAENLRWFTASRVRAPASELERGENSGSGY